jgi:FtsP/CotA-like multicopper oxidase with cupredoxin domain
VDFFQEQAGTYFYHGHYGMQRTAGLVGPLIVSLPQGKSELFSYDSEISIVLNDWWHKSIYEQELGLNSIPFNFVGEPQVCRTSYRDRLSEYRSEMSRSKSYQGRLQIYVRVFVCGHCCDDLQL